MKYHCFFLFLAILIRPKWNVYRQMKRKRLRNGHIHTQTYTYTHMSVWTHEKFCTTKTNERTNKRMNEQTSDQAKELWICFLFDLGSFTFYNFPCIPVFWFHFISFRLICSAKMVLCFYFCYWCCLFLFLSRPFRLLSIQCCCFRSSLYKYIYK